MVEFIDLVLKGLSRFSRSADFANLFDEIANLFDFGGFKSITEAVGGVEICLSEPVNDPLSGLKLSAGKHTISGEEALAFVRARKTLGDGSDTSRIRRQQAFLSSMAKKVLSSGTLLNPAALLRGRHPR